MPDNKFSSFNFYIMVERKFPKKNDIYRTPQNKKKFNKNYSVTFSSFFEDELRYYKPATYNFNSKFP